MINVSTLWIVSLFAPKSFINGGVKNGTNTIRLTKKGGQGHRGPVWLRQFHVEQMDAAETIHAIRPVTKALSGPTGWSFCGSEDEREGRS